MLIEAAASSSQPGHASDVAPAASPYPGLRPFNEPDSLLFFGREGETAALLTILESQQLVVVHGTSGCGKSSLVRAGLLPVFRMDVAANGKQDHVVIVRPADEGGPLQSLARKLDAEIGLTPVSDEEAGDVEPPSWSRILTTSPDWARDIGDRVAASGGALCILFDQFEEIFAATKAGHAAQVNRVIDFLNSLSEPSPEGTALGGRPISVVVTMRSDYLGNCAIWEGFAETVNRCQYLLPRISAVGLLRAIHEPARITGGHVDEQVAERLLAVVKSEMDGLPIAQHALSRAWHWSEASRGTRDVDQQAMAEVGGADCALSHHADEVFAAATSGDPRLEAVANWVLRSLSDLDTDGRIIRRSIPFDQLLAEVGEDRRTLEAVLRPFRDPENSLIMPPSFDKLQDNTVISISHEALLRQWRRISESAFEGGRAVGLAFREFQDGVIWRALSVQAQQYAEDGKSILGPAATEQRLPWYREIEQRPGWMVRQETEAWSPTTTEVKRHWQQVADMMEASERNLEAEQKKLQREQEMVENLRRTHKKMWWLQAAVVASFATTIAIGSWYYMDLVEAKENVVAAQTDAILSAKNIDALRSAFFMAQRYCAGAASDGQADDACIVEQTEQFQKEGALDTIQQGRRDYAKLPPPSPYIGGLIKPAEKQGGAR